MEIGITKLQDLIDHSDNIVFFGGAGVSTESGIKDFRSVDGLYHMKFKYPPETMLSHSFWNAPAGKIPQSPIRRILSWRSWRRLASLKP